MIIERLVSVLGLEIEQDDLPKFRQNIIGTTAKLTGLIGVSFSAADAIKSVFDSARDATEAARFADSIDIGVRALSRLEFAGNQAGVSVGAIRGALEGLRTQSRGALSGLDGGAAGNFGQLGVDILDLNGKLKSADQLLLDVAQSVASAGDQSEEAFRFTIAQQLGLGSELNLLLELGAGGIAQLSAEGERLGAILGRDAAEKSLKFTKQIDALKKAVTNLVFEAGLPLIDWSTESAKRFGDFLKSDSGQGVVRLIGDLSKEIGGLLGTPARALQKINEFLEDLGVGNIANLQALAIAFTGLAAAFFPLGTGAALLVAALDDILKFMDGVENTFTEQFIDGFKNKLDQITEFIAPAVEALTPLFDALPGSGVLVPPERTLGSSAAGGLAPSAGGSFTFNIENKIDIAGNADAPTVRNAVRDAVTRSVVQQAAETLRKPITK